MAIPRQKSSLFIIIVTTLRFSRALFLNASAVSGGTVATNQYAGYDLCISGSCGNAAFQSIQGSFVVPSLLSCPASGLQFVHYSVTENLRDGAGIQFGCDTLPFYFVEIYMAGSVTGLGSPYTPHAGDHISVTISFNRSAKTISIRIHDSTHLWTYSTGPFTDNFLAFSVTADYYLSRGCTTSACPVPDFGTLKTSGDYVTLTSWSTSVKGSLGHWWASTSSQPKYATVSKSYMTDSDTGNTLARPASITGTSTGFGIMWIEST